MTTPELFPPKFISLKGHPTLNEKWLQDRLAENPSLLGLGDLQVLDIERRQSGAGRLDLLLSDPATLTRYEVEIQLGATDESHLVRTIEYWDIERRRFPQYDHVAVIVAEDITSRFLNVISLFNGHIPLIAIQLKGVYVGNAFSLVATKVIDEMPLGTEEDDEGELVNRAYWEHKAPESSLRIVDDLVKMVQEVEPNASATFNKHYIGLTVSGGTAQNFVSFVPQKSNVIARFKISQDEELTEKLDESGLSILPYAKTWGLYRVKVNQAVLRDKDHSTTMRELISRAKGAYFGNG